MAPHMRCRTAKGEALRGQPCSRASVNSLERKKTTRKAWKPSPGGARAGHASLMQPNRPLPTLPFAKSAATPKPEQCRGGPGGLGNPGASRLPFGLIARLARSKNSDVAHPRNL